MDRFQRIRRRRRDDRVGLGFQCPVLGPQPCQHHRVPIGMFDLVGLLGLALAFPLVESGDWHHAPPRFQQAPETGLLLQRLAARVDHLVADPGVLGPEGHQSPLQRHQSPLAHFGDADRHDMGRRDIVVGLEIGVGRGMEDVECVAIFRPVQFFLRIFTPAHRSTSPSV